MIYNFDFASTFRSFWNKHPALLYGVAVLLGSQCALNFNWVLLLPLLVLVVPFLMARSSITFRLRGILTIAVALAACMNVYLRYEFPALSKEGLKTVAHLEINAIKNSSSPFGMKWVYFGNLLSCEDNEVSFRMPCRVVLSGFKDHDRPSANFTYLICGVLKEVSSHQYVFIVKKDYPWIPISRSWNFSEYRYQAKQAVNRYIKKQIKQPKAASFLSGIVTGDFDDRSLASEFSRFGLQHIMAISGFHFSIVAAILGMMIRFFCGQKLAAIILISTLGFYFLFLGITPSIVRAWLMIVVFFGGQLTERRTYALNSLGIALGLTVILDPLLVNSLSFQFSFVTTAAILLLTASYDYGLEKIFSKRYLSEFIHMDLLNQHGYIILSYLKQSLALAAAVNTIALPMTLFYFYKFPVMSLAYNLFFPFLVSISILLLIWALLFSFFIPPLAAFLHAINSFYTSFVLSLTYNLPTYLDFYLRTQAVSFTMLIVYVTLVFALGILARNWLMKRENLLKDYSYL